MAQSITIVISKDGKVNIDVAGVKGGSCKAMTAAIEKALGKTVSDTAKAEMYQAETVSNGLKTGYGSK